MATTIDYGSDYENPSATIDYDGLTRGKLCPIYVAALTVSGHTSEDKYLAECGPAVPGMTPAKNAAPCYLSRAGAEEL